MKLDTCEVYRPQRVLLEAFYVPQKKYCHDLSSFLVTRIDQGIVRLFIRNLDVKTTEFAFFLLLKYENKKSALFVAVTTSLHFFFN